MNLYITMRCRFSRYAVAGGRIDGVAGQRILADLHVAVDRAGRQPLVERPHEGRRTLQRQRPPRLECNPDTPYQVRVDGGQHGGVGELRYLASDDRQARPIPYRLYRDAAWREPLAVGVAQSARVPGSGSVELPLYARIDKLAWVPDAGVYADLLKVTVTW